MAAYLSVALEEGDLGLIMATLGDIARARRMGSGGGGDAAGQGGASTSRCQPMATLNSPPCSRW